MCALHEGSGAHSVTSCYLNCYANTTPLVPHPTYLGYSLTCHHSFADDRSSS